MKNIKLNYFGQLGYQIVISLLILFLIIGFAVNFPTLPDREKLFLLYASPFISVAIILLKNNLLYQIRDIEVNNGIITFKNKVINKIETFELKDIKGFRFNGITYKVYLINQEDLKITEIYDPFYKDLNKFLYENKIEYLGKSKTWFSA